MKNWQRWRSRLFPEPSASKATSPAGSAEPATAARTSRQPLPGSERLISYCLVAIVVAFNLFYLYSEVGIRIPNLNDGAFHYLFIQQASDALTNGDNLFDHWSPTLELGFPQFLYYQHLPHLAVVLSDRLLLEQVSLLTQFNLIRYILLASLPVTVYWSMRRLGFSVVAAGFAAAAAPLLSADHRYGFEYDSYVWRGWGLYTQLWAMHLSFIALACLHGVLEKGKGYLPAVLVCSALVLSHLVYAYMMGISAVVLLAAGLTRTNLRTRLARFALTIGLTGVVTSYLWLPFLTSKEYLSVSPALQSFKYDSFGARQVLSWLTSGDLLDHGRLPIFTVLLAVGLVVALVRRTQPARLAVGLFVVWLALYFGRPTWGSLVDLLPLHDGLLMHRFIGGVDLASILLIGLGGECIWLLVTRLARSVPLPVALRSVPACWGALAAGLVLLALLMPALLERREYYEGNTQFMERTRAALEGNEDARTMLSTLAQQPAEGRTYAGLPGNWGQQMMVGDLSFRDLLTFYRIPEVSAPYQSLSLNSDLIWHFDDKNPAYYDLFNVTYVIAPTSLTMSDFLHPIKKTPRYTLYRADTSGYAEFAAVTERRSVGSQPDLFNGNLAWLLGPDPAARRFIRYDYPADSSGPIVPTTQGCGSGGTTSDQQVQADRLELLVQCEQPSTLVLKITYHPNWHVAVDGVEKETFMVSPSFIGVNVPAGLHHIDAQYQSQPLRSYLLIAGLLILPLLALAEWRREALAGLVERSRRGWRLRLSPGLDQERLGARVGGLWERARGRAREVLERLRGGVRELWPAGRRGAGAAPSAKTAVGAAAARSGAAETAAARARPLLRVVAGHLPFLAALGVAVVLAGLPLLSLDALGGHDSLAYLPRNVEFYEGLKAGQIYPRWAPDLGAGFGEPTFNYNPPVFYYVSAGFHFLGFGFIASEDLAAFALLALAGCGMYFLAQSFFGRRGGLAAAVAYTFAPFLLSCLYVRHAMADYTSFAFIPWALWGLHQYMTGGRYRFLLVGALSVALIFLSSSSISIYAVPTLGLLGAALAWRERSRAAAIRGGWLLLLGAGLAAFFVLPALAETRFVHIARREERIDFHDHFVYLWQFLYGAWGYGFSVAGSGDGMSFALGFAHLAAVAVCLWLLRRLWRTAWRTATVLAAALVVLLGALFFSSNLSLPLWEVLTPLHPLQFPWRFLVLAAVSTSFLFGAPFLLLRDRPRASYGLMAAAIGAVLLLNLPHAHPPDHLNLNEADYSPANIALHRIPATAREFEPIWVTQFPQETPTQKLAFLQGKGNIVTSRVSPYDYRFGVSVQREALARVNTFYFPGWQLYVDGEERTILHDNPQGLMEFPLAPGGHIVELRWGSTVARTWGAWLSALALLLLLATPWLGPRGLALLQRARALVRRAEAPVRGRSRRAAAPPGQKAQTH